MGARGAEIRKTKLYGWHPAGGVEPGSESATPDPPVRPSERTLMSEIQAASGIYGPRAGPPAPVTAPARRALLDTERHLGWHHGQDAPRATWTSSEEQEDAARQLAHAVEWAFVLDASPPLSVSVSR
jgi:hypothetical protein